MSYNLPAGRQRYLFHFFNSPTVPILSFSSNKENRAQKQIGIQYETPHFSAGRFTEIQPATGLNPWLEEKCETPRDELRGFYWDIEQMGTVKKVTVPI
jgi:hypothetical protein